jgi:hypothetical protein
MSKPDAFATIRRARSLRERHPDAPLSVIAIAQNLATYADGRTGTNIRPGHERIAEQTGLHSNTVRLGIRWLEDRGEIRCDKPGHRGSAACYTFLGIGDTPASDGGNGDTPASEWDNPASRAPTNQTSQHPSGLPGPRGGEAPHPGKQTVFTCAAGCGATVEMAHEWCPTCWAASR